MPGFFRQTEITKEDLVKLGLDPDKAVTKEELTALETRIKDSMTETIKASITELSNVLKPQQQQNQNDDKGGDKGGDNNDERRNQAEVSALDFMSDPVANARKIANESASVVLLQQIKFAAETAWERAKETLPGFKNEALTAEIETEWKKYPDAAKGTQPAALLRNLHDMVMGRHQEEIMRDTAKKEGKFNIIQAGGGTTRQNNTDQPKVKPEDALTSAELRAAASFGMTAAEYATTKGGLKYA